MKLRPSDNIPVFAVVCRLGGLFQSFIFLIVIRYCAATTPVMLCHIYLMSNLIDLEGKKYPSLRGPLWKRNFPLNLTTGCAKLGSKSCNQVSVITVRESFTLLRGNFGKLFFAEWISRSRLFQRSPIGLTYKTSFALKPFTGRLAGVFWLTVLSHNTTVFELQATNWWTDSLLQNFLEEWNFLRPLPFVWTMNSNLNWDEWGLQFSSLSPTLDKQSVERTGKWGQRETCDKGPWGNAPS